MKALNWFLAIVVLVLSGCGPQVMDMKNVNSGMQSTSEKVDVKPASVDLSSKSMLVLPDRSLGIEPTSSVRDGKYTSFEMWFPKRLYSGESFLGKIRWNTWTVSLTDGRESFGQIVYCGIHPKEGRYFGTNLIDDNQIRSGVTAILSSAVDYIYSPFDKELPVERERFLNEPAYRKEKIIQVNTLNDGTIFNLRDLKELPDFKWYVKNDWHEIKTPDGYLLSPYGFEEVAKIRGINPQYSYLQKLVGTGKFAVTPAVDAASMAMGISIGVLKDMISAIDAPSRGADYGSLVSRREMAYVGEYAQRLAEKFIQDFKAKKN